MEHPRELDVALEAAAAASRIIQQHRTKASTDVRTKPDGTPVTRADMEACAELVERIHRAFPADTIRSEELPPVHGCGSGRTWWIDPLDGTRDFMEGSPEFSVHIGLTDGGQVAGGVVMCPALEETYVGWPGLGAFLLGREGRIALHGPTPRPRPLWRIGISRTAPAPSLLHTLERHGLAEQAVPMGASTKFMRLAAGQLDAVINLSTNEMHWDTCAPHAVLAEAGCVLTAANGLPFDYALSTVTHPHGSLAAPVFLHAQWVQLLRMTP